MVAHEPDYHVEVEGHYHSVSCQLTREEMEERLTRSVVEVPWRGKRAASHSGSCVKGAATPPDGHRPAAHRAYPEWMLRVSPKARPLARRREEPRERKAIGTRAFLFARRVVEWQGR